MSCLRFDFRQLFSAVDELQDDEDYDDAWVLSKIEEIQEQLESADTALEAAKGNHRLLLSVFKAREGEAEDSMEGGDLEVPDASDSEEAMIVDDPGDGESFFVVVFGLFLNDYCL